MTVQHCSSWCTLLEYVDEDCRHCMEVCVVACGVFVYVCVCACVCLCVCVKLSSAQQLVILTIKQHINQDQPDSLH